MTVIGEASAWGKKLLTDKGLENPSVETEAILSGLLNVSPTDLYLNAKQELPEEVDGHFKDLVRRRSNHEPVAYLLGIKNFFGRDFRVSPDVLIPRPETELLAERVLKEIGSMKLKQVNVLDVGTGSGCIGVTVAAASSHAAVTAVDVSPKALSLASLNAEACGVDQKVQFIKSDLYAQLGPQFKGYFDIIVSNPPYISSSLLSSLEPDLHFEPQLALDGGVDGLFVLKPLIAGAGNFLKPRGFLVLEIGFDQGSVVSGLLQSSGFNDVQVLKDLNQHDRIVTGRFRGPI